MSEEYVEALRLAFQAPDLADPAILKLATKYLNFRQSAADDQNAIRTCSKLTGVEAANDSFPCYNSPVLTPRVGTGSTDDTKAVLYGFQLAKRLMKNPRDDVLKLEMALRSAMTESIRVELFLEYWKNWGKDEWFFWVGQHATKPDPGQLDEIIHGLGLFHWREVKPEDAVVMLTYEVINRQKPTWIDAELTFYFDACADVAAHGFTRCLRTGERRYPEWIARKKHLVPTDVQLLRPSSTMDLSTPCDDYWNALRATVEKIRAA